MAPLDYKKLAAQELERRDSTFPKWYFDLPDAPEDVLDVTVLPEKSGILSAKDIEITNSDGYGVVQAIRNKKWTCVEVIEAFSKRALLAQKYTNCLTELMYEEAIERAKYLDSLDKPIGPLHGLPLSVKEHLWIKGKPCNAGFAAWITRDPPTENNGVLDIFLSLGAIPFCRTTEPQALMHLSCNNNITGRTVCPYNRTLTSGGSSGGEGALIAMKGSCVGLGTDIGGSVRGPAANCGIYSLRQSALRLPMSGMSMAMVGAESILAILGPMCASQRDIQMFMEHTLATEPWKKDFSLVALPWRKPTLPKKIRVGIMWHDGVVVPHPPVTRSLKEVKAALEKYPDLFEVRDWQGLDHKLAWDITSSLYFMDGGAQDKAAMAESGEPHDPLTDFILGQKNVKDNTITEVWEIHQRRDAYRAEYYKHLTSDPEKPDVILCPVGPGVAPKHEQARYWNYTSLWNLLDYPAAVFPVSSVKEKEDWTRGPFLDEQDEWNWKQWELNGEKGYAHAPVCLQIVGARWEDENVVEAMARIEKAMGRSYE